MLHRVLRLSPALLLILSAAVALTGIVLSSCADHGRVVEDGGGEPPPLPTVSFKDNVQPILLGSCAFNNCHGDFNPQHGINVTSYAGITTNDPLHGRHIIPGDADVSAIYIAVTRRFREIGLQFRMPQFSDTLTSAQQDTIRIWINEGAIDN